MSTIFVDTNVFVRHFAQDAPGPSTQATAFLKRAETGEVDISITESVLLEIEHVLTSRALPYQLDRGAMVQALRAILSLAGLHLSRGDRLAFTMAVDLYETYSIDFGDALLAGRMHQSGATDLASFDHRHFDQLRNVTRVDLSRYMS